MKKGDILIRDKISGKYYTPYGQVGRTESYGGLNNASCFNVVDISSIRDGLYSSSTCKEEMFQVNDDYKLVRLE